MLSQGKPRTTGYHPPSGINKTSGMGWHHASGSLSKDISNKHLDSGGPNLAYQLNMRHNVNKGRTGTAPKAAEDLFSRPHTAAMLFQAAQTGGANRPYTGNQAGYFQRTRGTGGMMGSNGNLRGTFQGLQGAGRAVSAGFVPNTKIARYEDLIQRLKKLLEQEKKNLRLVKTMCASEIDTRNHLESILRKCVTDVQDEIARKRS